MPRRSRIATTLAVATLVVACDSAGAPTVAAVGPTSTPSSPAPAGSIRGLTALFPPASSRLQYYADVQTYLVNNPAAPVSGANFAVMWSQVDKGPAASPQYDFSSIDAEIQPWIAAGKKAYLTVQAVGYGTGTQTLNLTPAYVQSQVTILNCTGSAPAYWQQPYVNAYQALMAAVIQHYGTNPNIGYIRFGLGIGGETTIVDGFSAPSCQTQLTAAGYTKPVWLAYLGQMLTYEKSLKSPVPLMVGLNVPNFNAPDYTIPDSTAALAVSNGIGFGSQGLQASDVTNYAAGKPCTVDWCAMFTKFTGRVPLELQTIAASDPSGAGQVGSLATLLPFGLQLSARNFEIYYVDWLTAYDPNYPAYAQYHTAYSQALESAAAALK